MHECRMTYPLFTMVPIGIVRELYHVAEDFAENHDLAAEHGDKLIELIAQWYVGPEIPNRPHAVTADVQIPSGGAEGVLLSQGTGVGGWSFYIQDGKLHYVHNYVRRALYRVSSGDAVPTGRHQLRFEFEPTGKPDFAQGKGAPGRAQLYLITDSEGEMRMAMARQ